MSIEQKLYKVKLRCIDQRFAFKNSGVLCLALIFNFNNPRTTILHAKTIGCRLRIFNTKYNDWSTGFFGHLIRTYCSVVKASHGESGDIGPIPAGCLSAALWPFCVAPSSSVHWHARFLNCCSLYILFFLGFRQCRSRADRVVDLNTTFWHPLFWRSWIRVRACTSPHVRARHFGRDMAIVEPRSRCLGGDWLPGQWLRFSWFLENTAKTKASWETFLRLTPQTASRWVQNDQEKLVYSTCATRSEIFRCYSEAILPLFDVFN